MHQKKRDVKAKYQYIGFLPKTVRIKENGFWGINDFEGNEILSSNYIEIFTLSSGYGLIAARDAGFWDVYDYYGNRINNERFEQIYPYYGLFGMTKVKIGDNWGLLNKYGHLIIPAMYKKIEKFGKGIVLQNPNTEIEFIERSELMELKELRTDFKKKIKKPISKKIINLQSKRTRAL